MIVTEKEAATMWCPFARVLVSVDSDGGAVRGPVAVTSANRFHDNTVALCVGSACMAWRWEHPLLIADAARDGRKLETAKGFCGLAGKP